MISSPREVMPLNILADMTRNSALNIKTLKEFNQMEIFMLN